MVEQILDVDSIERDFARLHHLVDKLYQNDDDLPQQNSYLFHLKFSLVLSVVVQMKNTLSKFLDFEINEQEPELCWN